MRDKVISNALKMAQEMSASEAQEALNDLSEADRWFIGNLKFMIDIQILKVKGGKAEAIDKKALVEWILKYL